MIEVLTTSKFSKLIEDSVRKLKISYMEALLKHIEDTGMEPESAAKLINPIIKEKLRVEAENLRFLKKTGNKLPI